MLIADDLAPELSPSDGNRRVSAQLVRPRAAAILLLAEPTVSRRLPVVGRLTRCTRGELLSHKYPYRLLDHPASTLVFRRAGSGHIGPSRSGRTSVGLRAGS